MNLSDLNERFAIPGVLHFGANDTCMTYAEIHAAAADARLYLQGAQIVSWQPEEFDPVLYLSPRSEFAPGKAIRGGVPVVFPWFGSRAGEPKPPHSELPGPSHGFARIQTWSLVFAAVAGDDLHLTFSLGPSKESRQCESDHFRVALHLRIGQTLSIELGVINDLNAPGPLAFEEALHTYLRVADVTRVAVRGLAGVEYLDKRDNGARKTQADAPLTLTETTDRVFLDTDSTCTIDDPAAQRRLVLQKTGSQSTIVWNPWSTLTPTLSDMDPEGWRTMLCVETGNVDRNAITLAPGESHTMSVNIAVEKLA